MYNIVSIPTRYRYGTGNRSSTTRYVTNYWARWWAKETYSGFPKFESVEELGGRMAGMKEKKVSPVFVCVLRSISVSRLVLSCTFFSSFAKRSQDLSLKLDFIKLVTRLVSPQKGRIRSEYQGEEGCAPRTGRGCHAKEQVFYHGGVL
jgi:hypothetical protein